MKNQITRATRIQNHRLHQDQLAHSTADTDCVTSCASCGEVDDLVLEEDTETVFCEACSTPLSSLAFPEYYCDLGGEA